MNCFQGQLSFFKSIVHLSRVLVVFDQHVHSRTVLFEIECYKIKKLYTESLEEHVKEEQYMLNLGGGTKEKLKQARLNLQISQIELHQIEQTMKNDRLTMEADLEELQHLINIQKKNVHELKTRLNHAEIRAKNPGVITWIDNQVGKSVNQGAKLVAIANLEKFKAEGKISDIYLDQLYPGQQVILEINEKTKLGAKITSVLPAIENNIVRFNIRLNKESHPSLRPNMEVNIHVITSLRENVKRIRNLFFLIMITFVFSEFRKRGIVFYEPDR